MIDEVKALEDRYIEIENLISQPEVAVDHTRVQELAKEHSSLQNTVRLYREHQKLLIAQQEGLDGHRKAMALRRKGNRG